MGSADAWGYFVGPDICVDGWDCGTDGLHINRKGGSRSGQIFYRDGGIGGGEKQEGGWVTVPGGTNLQRGDIWGDGGEYRPGTFNVGLGDGWECYGYDRYGKWETAGSVMDITDMASGRRLGVLWI